MPVDGEKPLKTGTEWRKRLEGKQEIRHLQRWEPLKQVQEAKVRAKQSSTACGAGNNRASDQDESIEVELLWCGGNETKQGR